MIHIFSSSPVISHFGLCKPSNTPSFTPPPTPPLSTFEFATFELFSLPSFFYSIFPYFILIFLHILVGYW